MGMEKKMDGGGGGVIRWRGWEIGGGGRRGGLEGSESKVPDNL